MNRLLALVALFTAFTSRAQDYGFPFGKITLKELSENTYARDTGAAAVYLDEYGETTIVQGEESNILVHKYHAKIKILKTAGLEQANFEIPLYRSDERQQVLRTIQATTFSLDNVSMRETPLDPGNIFTENRNKYWQVKKFALSNVQVGSVIEVAYEMESPFIWNFKTWEFQSEIPKIKSEYVATIPAVYTYNISLNGFLKLTRNDSKLIKSCMGSGSALASGYSVDCSQFRYGMVNIPAFKEEDYMTAKKNFISAIHFELAEIRYLDGRVDKITMEWKDAEYELKRHDFFGMQLKKNGDLLKDEIAALVGTETDPLIKAKKIYQFIQQYFLWNGDDELFSDGIKTAVQNKKGNSADINLFLVGALRRQKIDASPVILSTRDNGVVSDLYPVLTGFNYVVAAIKINDKVYLADATDDLHPFGVLPEKCLNGKGRLLDESGSSWIALNPGDRGKNVLMINARLGADGIVHATLQNTMSGYEAIDFRKAYSSYSGQKDYLDGLKSKVPEIEITSLELSQLDDLEKPVIRTLEVEMTAFDEASGGSFLFNPFILGKLKENPFKSNARLYPVDFGAPMELTTIMNFEFPADVELLNLPENVGLSLPNSGGRYIVDAKALDNKVTLTNSLQINKTVFTSQEYHYLKELFQKVVDIQNTDLMFRKKL
jgi:hypothetical protein